MGQVTIYVEDSALQAAREAAAREHMSLSQWFAQFAAEEKHRQSNDWGAFFAELDALASPGDDDFPDLERLRQTEVAELPRESWCAPTWLTCWTPTS
jgi:hypothetical protein